MAALPSKSIPRIREQSARMRAMLDSRDLKATVPKSAWCVAEQLDHTIKVASWSIQVLLKPELPTLPYGINTLGRLVMLFGWIPRGLGKAPVKLVGTPATREQLETQLAELDSVLDRAAAEPPRGNEPVLRHPVFGGLSFAQALEFVVIHTRHHLKIIG
jgi:hypothetical protein